MSHKKSGSQAALVNAEKQPLFEGDGVASLAAEQWFNVATVAPAGSAFPSMKATEIFKSPAEGNQIVPVVGDSVYPLSLEILHKTDVQWSAEKGTIDVTDDSDEGYVSEIVDGYTKVSGSFSGFIHYDDVTHEITGGTLKILSRFYDIRKDDALGGYTLTPKTDNPLILMICLTKNAAIGQTQNWLLVPINITSISNSATLKDAQKIDVNWTKAQGLVSLYLRTVNQAGIL